MKKYFYTLMFAILFAAGVNAQTISVKDVVSDNVIYSIDEAMTKAGIANYTDIKKLIIDGGTMRSADCDTIRKSLINLEDLELIGDLDLGYEIPTYAFTKMGFLKRFVFKSTMTTEIGYGAFKECAALEQVELPYVTALSEVCFQKTGLKKVDLPELIEYYGAGCFRECPQLAVVNMPKVESLANYMFYACPKLVDVNAPNVIKIGSYALAYGGGLKYVSFPKVEVAMNQTFYGKNKTTDMPSLLSLRFGALDTIGNFALGNDLNLSTLTLGPVAPDSVATNIFNGFTASDPFPLILIPASQSAWGTIPPSLVEYKIGMTGYPVEKVFDCLIPDDQTVKAGGSATFTYSIPGATDFGWYKLEDDGTETELKGKTTASLTLSSVTEADAGRYMAVCMHGDRILYLPFARLNLDNGAGIRKVVKEDIARISTTCVRPGESIEVSLLDGYLGGEACIYSLTGGVMNTQTINGTSFSIESPRTPGIYLLRVVSNGSKTTVKFLVK